MPLFNRWSKTTHQKLEVNEKNKLKQKLLSMRNWKCHPTDAFKVLKEFTGTIWNSIFFGNLRYCVILYLLSPI